LADVHRFNRQLEKLKKRSPGQPSAEGDLKKLRQRILESKAICERRATSIPTSFEIASNLPVAAKADDIAALLTKHQVVVVAGETGSGKTTQLPKICLQAGFGRRGMIGHTQPRRLAAVSVAHRIAEELRVPLGQGVGYQVRFNDHSSAHSFLKLMTDGILLTEIQNDKFLNKYEVIIIDEAHERSLNIDFLLGYLHQLLHKRPELKVVITSATIDVEKFSQHFKNAPIVSVSGRTYPVETRYAPVEDIAARFSADEDPQINAIIESVQDIETVDKARGSHSGDVLVFLSSEREIRDTALKLRRRQFKNTEVLPLYARLRQSEQMKIFQPHSGRRIVLATNVAETSLTVPGINYVIDTGFARTSRYSVQSKVQRLPIEPVSQASAGQRQGRCGRMADGICIRLYSEEDFLSRPLYTDPEIRRTNLAAVILRMLFLRLGKIEEFPFLEPPEQKAINDGFKLLAELGAIDQQRKLTRIGQQMASMPLDPKFSRMIIDAAKYACLHELLIIVSALSVQDPRESPAEKRQQAQEKHSAFSHPDSDFFSFVTLWEHYEAKRQELSQNRLRKYCNENFLSFMRMKEWRDTHRQLLLSCQQLGFKRNPVPGGYKDIHCSLLAGYLNQVACLNEAKIYLGIRNRKFTLLPSSTLHKKTNKWIVSGELIETHRLFSGLAAKIEPAWVLEVAPHLVRRSYSEPHWSRKRQEVMAYEKISLFGLVIIEKVLVSYSHINATESRELFIRHGLIEQDIRTSFDFFQHNKSLLEMLEKQEEKLRRPNSIITERDLLEFYDRQIPESVTRTQNFDKWFRVQQRKQPDLLKLNLSDFESGDSLQAHMNAYPDEAELHRNRVVINYQFDPGSHNDGATVEVPLALVHQLTQADIDWAVPGLVKERCIAYLKALPKSIRKKFIPIALFVEEVSKNMRKEDGPLLDSLLTQVRLHRNLDIETALLENVDLPSHLLTKLHVMSTQDEVLAQGTSIAKVRAALHAADLLDTVAAAGKPSLNHSGGAGYGHPLEQQGLTDWTFEELPQQVELDADLKLLRYPSLCDKGDDVDIVLETDPARALDSNKTGLIRLYQLNSVQQRNQVRKQIGRFTKSNALKLAVFQGDWGKDLLYAIYAEAFDVNAEVPRNKRDYQQALMAGKRRLPTVAESYVHLLQTVSDTFYVIRQRLLGISSPELAYLKEDVEQQLTNLVPNQFLRNTEFVWLKEYPRYCKAIESRLDKISQLRVKDKINTEKLSQFWTQFVSFSAKTITNQPDKQAQMLHFRWMIEEFRVSLFAQHLKTRIPVSELRLNRQWDKLTTS